MCRISCSDKRLNVCNAWMKNTQDTAAGILGICELSLKRNIT